MYEVFHFLLSIMIIIGLSILTSNNRANIRFRYVFQLLVIELILAWLFLTSAIGHEFIIEFSKFFDCLLTYATVGTDFVFSGMIDANLATFFLRVLCPIVFISALIGILQHIKLLPIIINLIGTLLSKISGMGRLESFNAVSSLILGQSENFIAYKDILNKMTSCRMYTMAVTAMSTVPMAIVGSYMNMLNPKYVVAALILNMFSTFIIVSLINPNPYSVKDENEDFSKVITINNINSKPSFFEMLGGYILAGFKISFIVAAMLIAFIAIITAINDVFVSVFGISFQDCLGYVFYPLVWILGIPNEDLLKVGSIMAIKLVANEFIAIDYLKQITMDLSPRSIGILSVFLVSFANFSSIGIIVGTIKGLNEKQGNIVSSFGLKILYGSTLVSYLSAAITGLFL